MDNTIGDQIKISQLAETPGQGDIERGLRFAHVMMSINQHEGREGAVWARALANLLVNKGLVQETELNTMMDQVRTEIAELPAPKVMLGKSEDKYQCAKTVAIDCASRVHLCHAMCCTLDFYLTEQDLDEGVIDWDYGRPYWAKKLETGYCSHCEPESLHCRIHDQRPYVCRVYDCREDKRVWVDFEAYIPNPDLAQLGSGSDRQNGSGMGKA